MQDEFENSAFEACFGPPWTCPKAQTVVWQPTNQCPAFVNAVNQWIHLSRVALNPFVKRCLLLHIDLFLTRILEIDSCGSFTSFGKNNCNYWKQLDDKIIPLIVTEVLPPSKTSKNHILHLLSKALPQRCQIRNLREIIISYCAESDETYAFIMMILKKSLFGLYDCATVPLVFEGRVIIQKSFVNQLCSKSFFTRWFRSGASSSQHQIFIFYCLKEYLVNAVKQCAPVFDVLDKKHQWSKFHNQVTQFMDEARGKLNVMAKREFGFLHRSDWLASIEQILTSAAKSHVKLFRTTPVLGYYNKLKVDISKFFYAKNHFCLNSLIPKNVEHFLWKYAQRCQLGQIFDALFYCGVDHTVVRAVKNKTFSSNDFHKHNDRSLQYIVELCRLRDLCTNITFYALPEHIYQQQKKTLALKERSDVACESTSAPFCPHRTSAINYVCLVCLDVKIFIMQTTRKNNRHSNRLSRGSLRVVVNNDSDQLRLCCGRRPERHTKNGKRKFKDSEDTQNRKARKERVRDAVADRCIATPCLEVDLLGNALSFFDKLYILCTICGNACILDKKAFRYSSMPNCQTCHSLSQQQCIKCKVTTHTTDVLCLNQSTGHFVRAPFCNACSFTYASKQPILL